MQHRQSERHLRTLGNTKNAAAAPIHRDGGGRKKGPRPGVAKSSPYTGVKWSLRQQMWTVSTKVQGATIHIGVFDDEQEVRKHLFVSRTTYLSRSTCSPPPLSRSYLVRRTPPLALHSHRMHSHATHTHNTRHPFPHLTMPSSSTLLFLPLS